ncbi:MAG: histidine kinase [Chitinophagaceae bacterium]|nr:histidine kinase [Chitinophagaceae bacterium]
MLHKPAISLYWKCQLIFWSIAALQWAYIGYIGTGFSWKLAVLHFALDLIIYIVPSHLYRDLSKRLGWHNLSLPKLLVRLIPSIIVLGFIFMVLTITKNYLVRSWFQLNFTQTLKEAFDTQYLITFITGIRLMSIWLLAYYAYHYAQREINAVKETSRLELMTKDAAFNNLSTQLNPHFFFNSLNSIKALVVEDAKAARRAIDILSDLLRTSLYSGQDNLISLKKELALVEDYLELEKIRFEENLQITIQAVENLMNKQVLRLSIQTLVENAIKHGISQLPQGGSIKIDVSQNEDQIIITVENSGKLNQPQQKGIGLGNLQERLQLQYNNKASFRLLQETPNTVIAIIKTPVI